MFWRKEREAVAALRRQSEQDGREKEAARLNFQRSLKQLARAIEELDGGLTSLGNDIAGNTEKR